VRELREVPEGNVERLAPAHRESGNRAVRAIRENPVVPLHVRHDVVDEFERERVDGRRAGGSRRGARRRSARRGARHRGLMPGRHHDDHRHGLFCRDQVVEDEARPPHRRPRIVGVAGAMQQVEDRVLLIPRLVSGRSVHVHPPGRLQNG
jgi:hypothetical protein